MQMPSPRVVAVVGFKKVGKTKVVEALVKELTNRGRRVGTLKHTSRDYVLDSSGKDTWRHSAAGSVASAVLTPKKAAIFVNHRVSASNAISKLGHVDIVVIEGFKSLDFVPRVVVARNKEDVDSLANGLEIGIVSSSPFRVENKKIPVFLFENVTGLADIVEAKSFSLLSGKDCGSCGYTKCGDLARAILAGTARVEQCSIKKYGS
jgi:molybdopterin-guanine dinucleotide biosynthesis protein B